MSERYSYVGRAHVWREHSYVEGTHVWREHSCVGVFTCGENIHMWKVLMCGWFVHMCKELTCKCPLHMWALSTYEWALNMWVPTTCDFSLPRKKIYRKLLSTFASEFSFIDEHILFANCIVFCKHRRISYNMIITEKNCASERTRTYERKIRGSIWRKNNTQC